MAVETVVLTNKNGERKLVSLIETGAALDAEIKEATERFKLLKEEINELTQGGKKYVTPNGHSLTVSESDKYTDVDPAAAKQALRDKRLGKFFLDVVKVQLTGLAKYLSETELNELREKVGSTRRLSFR
jgi:hypothetical protein